MWVERYEWWIEQKEKLGIEHENFDEFYASKNPQPVVEDADAEALQVGCLSSSASFSDNCLG